MREAILMAEPDAWEYFLARSQFEQFQRRRRQTLNTETQWSQYQVEINDFEKAAAAAKTTQLERRAKLAPLYTQITGRTTDLKEKLQVMEQIYTLIPDNRNILAALAYYSAAEEDWSKSLGYIRDFLQTRVRQNARSMSIGLLEACVLNFQGEDNAAQNILETYGSRIRTPWFVDIRDYFMGNQTEKSLKEKAGEIPEKLVTAYTLMGFWNESCRRPDSALKHYKEALESFLDYWLEYDFARERFKRLKKSVGPDKKS
jgi:hypothetical protein